MKRLIASALLTTALALPACGGGGEEPDRAGAQEDGERRQVVVADTIGVEMGDSNYVFGALEGICFGPEGNLHALDLVRGSVMVYGPDGGYIRSISRRGEGPGEIRMPLDMTVLGNGRVLVTAMGGIHGFTPQGEHLGVLGEYLQNPPMNLTALGESSFVASKLSVEPDESGNALMKYWLGRFTDPSEPELYYDEGSMPFEPDRLTDMLERTWLAYSLAGDGRGGLYLAPRSSEDFRVEVWSAEGELLRTMELDVPRAEKTPEEIAEEKAWMELRLENMGVNGVVIEYEPDPYRRMITDLGVDAQGRVWARRGTELKPVFEVFSPEGEHLFTAEIPGVGDEGQFWSFAISPNGMAAFSTNPELYQQIYVLEPANPVPDVN